MKTKDLTTMLHEAVIAYYGENIPSEISTRLREEWDVIQSQKIENDFTRACNITNKLRQHHIPWIISGVEGGSSLIAFLLEITQVNPIPPHYYCPKCKKVEFISDVKSGFDLPNKPCTSCSTTMVGDGHNINFSWFTDVVCSFSEWPLINEFRVPDLTDSVIEELSSVSDLPVAYNNFELGKQRILFVPTDHLTQIRCLCQKTGIEEKNIPTNDTKSLNNIFGSLMKAPIEKSDLACTIGLLQTEEERISNESQIWRKSANTASLFSDLLQFLGLQHMTLVENYELPSELWDVFCDRNSVFEYLCRHGLSTEIAFDFARNICKGKHISEIQTQLKSLSIDPRVIEAAMHTRYLFPRAHNISYSMLYTRLAWFNLHYPDEYMQIINNEV